MKYKAFIFLKEILFKPTPILNCGWGNGYVAIPKYNLFYGCDYNDKIIINNKKITPELYFQVHGGITYSDKLTPDFYLDYNHSLDYWVFGFDTAHYNDNPYNCPKEYVEKQALYLKKQIDKRKFYDIVYLRKEKLNNLKI